MGLPDAEAAAELGFCHVLAGQEALDVVRAAGQAALLPQYLADPGPLRLGEHIDGHGPVDGNRLPPLEKLRHYPAVDQRT